MLCCMKEGAYKPEAKIPEGLKHPKDARTYDELRDLFVSSINSHGNMIESTVDKHPSIAAVEHVKDVDLPRTEAALQKLEDKITQYLRFLILASARADELRNQPFLSVTKISEITALDSRIKETSRSFAYSHKGVVDALEVARKKMKEVSPFAWN